MSDTILIYTPRVTNRSSYTFKYIFEGCWGMPYQFTTSIEDYTSSQSPKICYSAEPPTSDGIYFYATGLLNESNIRQQRLDEDSNKRIFFKHDMPAALNFDVFSAIFYLLSRYEEYMDAPKDEYGNYDYANSILSKLNILHEPVIEIWLRQLQQLLLAKYPGLSFKTQSPRYALSFDIDVAFEYRHRGFIRTAGGFAKKLLQFNFTEFYQQLLTITGSKQDAFDTYDYILSQCSNKALFFFNMGDYGSHDKNPDHKNDAFTAVIRKIHAAHLVGLHPSWKSNENEELLQVECSRLQDIIQAKVERSRQHYLRLSMPATYRALIANGIKEDHTMGYYSAYGFRAGTCNPFYFFDLEADKATDICLYPFVYMDGTLNDVLHKTTAEAIEIVSSLIETVHKYNGVFIPLWHNSTLAETANWKGWREVFEHTVNSLEQKNFKPLFS